MRLRDPVHGRDRGPGAFGEIPEKNRSGRGKSGELYKSTAVAWEPLDKAPGTGVG